MGCKLLLVIRDHVRREGRVSGHFGSTDPMSPASTTIYLHLSNPAVTIRAGNSESFVDSVDGSNDTKVFPFGVSPRNNAKTRDELDTVIGWS